MKKYIIAYNKQGVIKYWTEKSGMELKNVLSYFTYVTGNEIDSITNIAIEEVAEDSLIAFLDAIPSCLKCGDTGTKEGDLSSPQGYECDCVVESKELTQREKELVWQADLDAENRINAIELEYHN